MSNFLSDSEEITVENLQRANFPLVFKIDDFFGTGELCKDFDIPVFDSFIKIRFYPNFNPNCRVWVVAGNNIIGLHKIQKMKQLAYLYKIIMGTL